MTTRTLAGMSRLAMYADEQRFELRHEGVIVVRTAKSSRLPELVKRQLANGAGRLVDRRHRRTRLPNLKMLRDGAGDACPRRCRRLIRIGLHQVEGGMFLAEVVFTHPGVG